MGIILFTKQGYENLKQELENEIAKRPAAVAVLKRAREMGDLSENGLYKAAKFELSDIDRNIRYLKHLVLHGKPSEPVSNDFVQFGHKVSVENKNGKRNFMIVGEYEANPREDKISLKSPIGHNLMGRKAGEKILISTPQGIIEYKIIGIAKQ